MAMKFYHRVLNYNKVNTLNCLAKQIRSQTNMEFFNTNYSFNNRFTLESSKSILEEYNNMDWVDYVQQIKCKNAIRPFNSSSYYKLLLPYTDKYDLFDMYLIKWPMGSISNVHGHHDYGCIFKVLQGDLNEKIYQGEASDYDSKNVILDNKLNRNDTSYIDNEIGYHQIKNNSDSMCGYTLHIYGKNRERH